ncbi:MAG: FAD binding domain-containing protein [Actinobacteria bacterium]|nr:FAD binding domain-containing protein [Actinomycetota bacterium]
MNRSSRVFLPRTLNEAVAAKKDHPQARYVAGGTHLVGDEARRGEPSAAYISLRRVPELTSFSVDGERIRVGAAVTIAQLRTLSETESVPVITQASRGLASRQIRERATVGGNLCTLAPDRTLPPCFLALDAEIGLISQTGERRVPLAEFYGAGPHSFLSQGEIVTNVSWRKTSGFQGFSRIGRRNALCFAIVSVALVVDQERRAVRVGLGNVGRVPRATIAAEELISEAIDWASLSASADAVESFALAVSAGCQPETDGVSTATYRRHAIRVMARRLLEQAIERGPVR